MKLTGTGIGYAPGIGQVCVLQSTLPEFATFLDAHADRAQEYERAHAALQDLGRWYEQRAATAEQDDVRELCRFYVMVLASPALGKTVETAITTQGMTAAAALSDALQEQQNKLAGLDNAYLSQRADDIFDLRQRLLKLLFGIQDPDFSEMTEPTIVVVRELLPSLLLSPDLGQVKGFVTEVGGKTSHAAILCGILGVPAVFGCTDATTVLAPEALALVDPAAGLVKTDLDAHDLKAAQVRIARIQAQAQQLECGIGAAVETRDHHSLYVTANAGDLCELNEVARVCPEGIGLFRTEFLYLDRVSAPTEDYLYAVARELLEKIPGTVTLRTLDIGGDKAVPYLNIVKEDNPFLGNRGIRFSLRQPELFKTSLRAFLRASAHANHRLELMFPLVSTPSEVHDALNILAEIKEEFDQASVAYDHQLPVGVMIETPAAALRAAAYLDLVDFVSIGTNDLVQYTLAVDRGNAAISDLYTCFDPAVIALIAGVIAAAKASGDVRRVKMCGEMAADPRAQILLVGLGLETFSVSTSAVLRTKYLLGLLDKATCETVATEVCALDTAPEIESVLTNYAQQMFGEWYL